MRFGYFRVDRFVKGEIRHRTVWLSCGRTIWHIWLGDLGGRYNAPIMPGASYKELFASPMSQTNSYARSHYHVPANPGIEKEAERGGGS